MTARVLLLLFAALSLAVHAEKLDRLPHLSGDDAEERDDLRHLTGEDDDDGHDHEGHDHEGHDDHEHEEGHGWAWAGVFNLEADRTYTWSCARGTDGEYAAEDLKFLMVPASSADHEGLEAVEELAESLWDDPNATHVESGQMVPRGTLVHLELDQRSWVSTFMVRTAAPGAHAVFTAHPPAEFENGFHYLKDSHGHDVEPVVSEGHDHKEHTEEDTEHDDKIGEVIIAGAVIALPSVVVIAGVGPFLHLMQRIVQDWSIAMYSFASGAVMACAVFLLFPEGFLLASVNKSETDATWTWGVCIMAGWLLCVLIHWLCDIAFLSRTAACSHATHEGTDIVPQEEQMAGKQAVDWAVAGPVLLGDFWHNLVDGMVLGFSAKLCGSTMTWTIVGVTVAHELPQEISDFFVLVIKAKMKWYWAAVLNLASGLASVLGAIVAYETAVGANFRGLSLAFGGGVYLFVAMTELGPPMMSKAGKADCAMRFCAFALGAASVGLVLTGHKHCSAPGTSDDPHAGHNHR